MGKKKSKAFPIEEALTYIPRIGECELDLELAKERWDPDYCFIQTAGVGYVSTALALIGEDRKSWYAISPEDAMYLIHCLQLEQFWKSAAVCYYGNRLPNVIGI